MNALIELTSKTLNIPPEKVVFEAYLYAERMPNKAEQKRIVQTLCQELIPDEVEDFCLDVLSGKIRPRYYEKIFTP